MAIDWRQWRSQVAQGAAHLGIEVDGGQCEQFAVHAGELLLWNRRINLTAITDPQAVAIKHFVDSLAPVPWISPRAHILDIGSGGGFPGLPLKIVSPKTSLLSIDSVRKKASFQQQVIRLLGLENARALHIRAQELAKSKAYQETFDAVISRAFTALEHFAELARPFLAPNGKLIAMKGRLEEQELFALEQKRRALALQAPEIFRYTLPVAGAERTLVIVGAG